MKRVKTHEKLTRIEATLFFTVVAAMLAFSLWTLWNTNVLLFIGVAIPFLYLLLVYVEKVCGVCPNNDCPVKWIKPKKLKKRK